MSTRKMIFVRPLDGRKIRNPENSFQYLPDTGDWVTKAHNAYWLMMVRDGAVEIVANPE